MLFRSAVKSAFKTFMGSKLTAKEALEKMKKDHPESAEVAAMVKFVEASERGVHR